MLKRKFLVLIAIAFVVASCGGRSFVRTTADLLNANKITFEVSRDGTASLYKQGLIPETDKEKLIEYGEIYAKSHNTAVEALARYRESQHAADADIVDQQVKILLDTIYEFFQIARPYLLGR